MLLDKKFILCFSILVCIIFLLPYASNAQELKIHIINVTKGDATFIEFPDGTTWLIDQGNSGTSGHRIRQYICNLGYNDSTNKIDYVVATHFDQDHYGGIDEVLHQGSPSQGPPYLSYKVAAYEHVGPKITGDDSYTAIWDDETDGSPASEGPMRCSPSPGQTWSFGGVTVQCVCIGNTDEQRNYLVDGTYVGSLGSSDENRYSVGFRISWNGFDYLTCGDVTSNVEDVLDDKISSNNFDVLHANHHGSSTSTSLTWCETLQPEVAVISVGASNSYGHPTQQTVNNLNGVGSSWGGVDWIYVTEQGSRSPGSASNMSYLNDHIVITYNNGTNQYTIQGGSTNDLYIADEGVSWPFPRRVNFQPAAAPTVSGYREDHGSPYGAGYGWH